MAQNIFACLHGTRVAITNVTGPFRACQSCGHTQAELHVMAVPGHHAAELTCAGCGAHTAWLSRDHLTAMLAQKRGAA